MNKQEFIDALRAALSGLPADDVEERLSFYGEMIDDRIEDGLTEEQATADIGKIKDVAAQIIADTPLSKIAKERLRPKRRWQAWEIVLLALGSPIWFSLAVAAFSVALSLYAVLWSLLISLWAVFAALVGCAVGGIAAGILFIIRKSVPSGVALLSASLLCAGLGILMFFACLAATKGCIRLTKVVALGMKKRLLKKEDVQ